MKAKMKKKLGQNTAEYLIMLVLIAGGSIGLFTIFGTTIRKHMSNVVMAFGGDKDAWQTSMNADVKKAGEIGKNAVTMKGITATDSVPSLGSGS